MRKFLAVAVLVSTAGSLSAQSKRPATFDDVLNIKAIQGATISPDGRWVIYGVREWVSEQDEEGIAHARLEGGDRRQLAGATDHFGEKGESQAQFSPDGKFISFVAARGSAEPSRRST
jgi:Tol biopolymer transport system component